jgi:DNA-binding response OmpR family regulator
MADSPVSLLLVEDEDCLRELVAHFLRRACYHVVEAEDGGAAIDRFQDSGPFDIALVDLNLPRYSGVEVCRRIRDANPAQPIIICSGAVLSTHETELSAIGVTEYLTKPYPPSVLLARIAGALAG